MRFDVNADRIYAPNSTCHHITGMAQTNMRARQTGFALCEKFAARIGVENPGPGNNPAI
jgi:hypothetical protein